MYKIIRYFKLIKEPTKGWGKVPEANHINQGDDAERMRFFRNDYVHHPDLKVSDEEFQDFFMKSSEIAGRLDITIGRLVNGFKEQVTNRKTCVIGDSAVDRDKMCSSETGSDEYILRLLIHGKAECQKLVDYVKNYPESFSSPGIQIKDAEQGSVILHISIDRKSFTSCEILHNEIQLFINTIFRHKEIQWTSMSDFDMVLAIADYTERGSHDRTTISSDHSYLTEEMFDRRNTKGVKIHLNIPKKAFAKRNDFYLHMESVLRAVISATTLNISTDAPIQAILMKCDRKEVSEIGIKKEEISLKTTEGTEAVEEGNAQFHECLGITHFYGQITFNISKKKTFRKEIGIPLEEISMTTNKSAQAATRGKWDFKDIGENIAMFCTNSNTEVLIDSNYCHKCGHEINNKQGSEPELRMAQAAKDKIFRTFDIDEIANKLVSGEKQEEFKKICKENIERWKAKYVKFCITGASRTGKSSFINAITGCKKDEEGFAEISVYGDTTTKATCYTHPKNSKFKLWDLPGVGTVHHKSAEYVNSMELSTYDYVLIFFEVISENDICLAIKLKRLGKSFCFVRSKLDIDKKK
ncbi:unnamed protein product [Mytilus coruscus]|uniref:IRG-type G domain-containing protein n=1 Tax=Mytilus coruscus TaxID=42192 RepID=A0A6J8CVU3_MYTCO|nr:unnamed protein product [Mytilus coruscus]